MFQSASSSYWHDINILETLQMCIELLYFSLIFHIICSRQVCLHCCFITWPWISNTHPTQWRWYGGRLIWSVPDFLKCAMEICTIYAYRTSTTGLFATLGKFICWRCAHRWVYSVKSKADIVPVTLVSMYAVTCNFTSAIRLARQRGMFWMFPLVHLNH